MSESRRTGPLVLLRGFVNSIDLERPDDPDPFAEPALAQGWLEQWGLGAGRVTPEQLPSLRALREALREELECRAGSDGTLGALGAVLGGYELRVVFGGPGEPAFRYAPAPGEPGWLLRDAIAATLYEAMRDGSWARLKVCAKPSCRAAFVDQSKNGSGRWCSMGSCGNRAKAARRRERDRIIHNR